MRSSARATLPGFTLLEVLAAVLVLGLIYTLLADATVRGVRSEGIDRRTAEASLIADQTLSDLEISHDEGIALELGRFEELREPFTVIVEVVPEDVLGMLPEEVLELPDSDEREAAPTLLADARGESRVQRLNVTVQWDEAGSPQRVERTTHFFDTSVLAGLFPQGEGAGGFGGAGGELDEEDDDGSGDSSTSSSSPGRNTPSRASGNNKQRKLDELRRALGGNLPPELLQALIDAGSE